MELKELLSSFAQVTLFAMMLSMGMVLGFGGMVRRGAGPRCCFVVYWRRLWWCPWRPWW